MSKELDDFNLQIAKEKDLLQREKKVREKGLELREHQVDRDLEELQRNKAEMEQAKITDYTQMSDSSIKELVKENDEYMEASKYPMTFINDEFTKIVPFFKRNLLLIGGDTGDGKSTACANLIFNVITRKNPATGKGARVLLLCNEEASNDYFNRLTSLVKGWKYTNHNEFTDEQRQTFNEWIPIWTKNGRLTIISDTYENVSGQTTSVEGVETIFNNLIRDYENGKEVYDAVFIDYYQNVRYSKMNPKLDEYMCQRRLAGILDQVKLRYPGPVVVFAQNKKLVDENDSTPFNVRLKGSKLICDKATFTCEVIPERQYLRSKFVVHKSRFTESMGKSVYVGYDKGKFVEYDNAFMTKVAKLVDMNINRQKEKETGIANKKEEDKND